jgi:hypothetical protein
MSHAVLSGLLGPSRVNALLQGISVPAEHERGVPVVGLETAGRPRLALLNGNASERGPLADAELTPVSLTFDPLRE